MSIQPNMSKIINYNKRPIFLCYSEKLFSEEELKYFTKIEVIGSGKGRNYNQVEQEAQLYLIRDAILKNPNRRLNKIIGIKQETDYTQEDGEIVKIVLNGIAIFK
jgi:hypothetical protein